MKKTPVPDATRDELRPEYRFDYAKARPNRFAVGNVADQRLIVLDADVAAVFTTPEAVNSVLRALIAVMPKASRRARARRSPT